MVTPSLQMSVVQQTTRHRYTNYIRAIALEEADGLLGALSTLCDAHGRLYRVDERYIDLDAVIRRVTFVRDQLMVVPHISDVRCYREFILNPQNLID